MTRGCLRAALAVTAVMVIACAGRAQAQALAYDGAPLRELIADVERRTAWRFLYPDALVAGKRVTLRADAAALPDALGRALAPQGVGVEADGARARILLVPARPADAPPGTTRPPDETAAPAPVRRVVRGRVVDAETGAPLPFATVTWDGGRRGVAADAAGAFVLTLPGPDPVELTASFLGYARQTAAPRGQTATFRLAPDIATQPDVVIRAGLVAPLDTAWAARLRPGLYDAVAEGGGLSALGVLPAVAPGGAFSDGPVVRGSAADAFEVRLDGAPVYNPQHLFGLVDAFNDDALRAVALYLGVAPPRVAVAPGGAIDYATATGAPRRPSAEVGVSSLAARAAVAVPLRPGRTSVLAGARASLLGAPWAQARTLVEQGLGAVQRTSPLPADGGLMAVLDSTDAQAAFWDVHLGAADERPDGGRLTVAAYAGGDDTRLDGLRFTATGGTPVTTENRWGSRIASVTDERPLSARLSLTTRLAQSRYDARFGQDDFSFRTADGASVFADTLGYRNELREAVLQQRLGAVVGGGLTTGGYSLHLYRQRYDETAADAPAYSTDQAATRLDLHAGWAGRAAGRLDLDAGLRAHVYTAGAPVRLSPRLRARLALTPTLAVSAAAGRSTQFVHRLSLSGIAGAAAWVLSGADQTVSEADLAEATVELGAGDVAAQLTGYVKRSRGLWFHAEDRAVRGRPDEPVLARPWLSGIDGWARGLEALARAPLGTWRLAASAALARSELSAPELDGGQPFAADHDRLARLTLLADGPVLAGVRLAAAWTGATGAPNPLAGQSDEADRLPALSRLDLRLTGSRPLGAARATLSVAVRNVLDRDNAVTRELTTLVGLADDEPRIQVVPLDVYDLGVLPTVDLSVRW